jgi:hypothetical protein
MFNSKMMKLKKKLIEKHYKILNKASEHRFSQSMIYIINLFHINPYIIWSEFIFEETKTLFLVILFGQLKQGRR